MKNAVIKSLYESMSMLRESYEYWTEEDWAKKLKKVCHLNKEEADDLLHDLNNLRGNEWLEIVEDNCDDEKLLIAFKEFIGANDVWEDEFDESLNENMGDVITIDFEIDFTPEDIAQTLKLKNNLKKHDIELLDISETSSPFMDSEVVIRGKKEDIIDFLSSKYFGWHIEEVQEFYPELFDESLNEAIKTVDRYKLTDRFWKYFDASVKGMRLIDNLSVLTGKSRDDILSLNTKDAWEKFPKDGFLGYFSTDDIKKAVYEYEGRIPYSSLKRSADEVLKEDYNSDLQIEREVQKYLDDHNLWGEVSVQDGTVYIEIHWGDWKHDHWYCQDLMSDLGYVLIGKEVTEEDGSDTFSAIHTYEKLDVNEE